MTKSPFRYFKTSPEIIQLAVMMYVHYPLSLRHVEDPFHERGIDICHESVQHWWNRFGPFFAAKIRKYRINQRSCSVWRWHVDEVFAKIAGENHYLWRAIDQEGEILEAYVTKTKDNAAALKSLRKAMKRYGSPKVIVTDGLASCGAAMKEIGNQQKRDTERYLNNRIESSHLPFRRRERAMQRFWRMRSLQKIAAIHSTVYNHFNLDRHLNSRATFKANRDIALQDWQALIAT